MLKKIFTLLFKIKSRNAVNGGVVPIVRSCKAAVSLNPEQIKQRLVRDMVTELINYTEFSEELQDNGVMLLTARLDVIRRDYFAEQRPN